MSHAPEPSEPLSLLARLFRERRSGVLSIGPAETALRVLLRDGQIVGLGPISASSPAPRPRLPRPDDSARRRLDRVLAEIGIRSLPAKPAPATAPPSRNLRERVLETLADRSLTATFEEGADVPADVAETAGATEPLILEAVRQMRDAGTVRTALGDLDQRLVATAALAEERTLTLTEGYLLSRIDGVTSARQVLQLIPLDPEETERTLLGLIFTGRVEYRAAAAPRLVPRPEAESPTPIAEPAEAVAKPAEPVDAPLPAATEDPVTPPEPFPQDHPVEAEPPPQDATAPPAAVELDPETLERRREILELFQSMPVKNHFEVLGVEPGCSDADVKRAYTKLVKRYHPDVHRDPRIEDLHDILEAIVIRVGEAWEVLGDARSRASYETRFGAIHRSGAGSPSPTSPPGAAAPPAAELYFAPEDTLYKAQLLLSQERYWDAIQVLEAAVPRMEPRRHQHRGRILLARAYAKNPNWIRRAEETLQNVVREDPVNVDAHYALGLLYKETGLAARAQAMFRRVVELRPDHREATAELGPGDGPGGGGLLKRIFGRGKAS
ncbi:MAG TPA: DnaJ domain-containing protein [Vicinamibacteria bacterium]|nr:DnaJ domain-containing protein [Vicinamibacteria bacterium]